MPDHDTFLAAVAAMGPWTGASLRAWARARGVPDDDVARYHALSTRTDVRRGKEFVRSLVIETDAHGQRRFRAEPMTRMVVESAPLSLDGLGEWARERGFDPYEVAAVLASSGMSYAEWAAVTYVGPDVVREVSVHVEGAHRGAPPWPDVRPRDEPPLRAPVLDLETTEFGYGWRALDDKVARPDRTDAFDTFDTVYGRSPLSLMFPETLATVLRRRLGPPNVATDEGKDMGPAWCVATPDPDLKVMVRPGYHSFDVVRLVVPEHLTNVRGDIDPAFRDRANALERAVLHELCRPVAVRDTTVGGVPGIGPEHYDVDAPTNDRPDGPFFVAEPHPNACAAVHPSLLAPGAIRLVAYAGVVGGGDVECGANVLEGMARDAFVQAVLVDPLRLPMAFVASHAHGYDDRVWFPEGFPEKDDGLGLATVAATLTPEDVEAAARRMSEIPGLWSAVGGRTRAREAVLDVELDLAWVGGRETVPVDTDRIDSFGGPAAASEGLEAFPEGSKSRATLEDLLARGHRETVALTLKRVVTAAYAKSPPSDWTSSPGVVELDFGVPDERREALRAARESMADATPPAPGP